MQTYAFLCETSYQLLNSIAYVIQLKKESNIKADIYVDVSKPGMESASDTLRNEAVFDRVFQYNTSKNNSGKYRYLVSRLCEYLLPYTACKRVMIDQADLYCKYDNIVIGCPNPYMVNFISFHRGAKVIFIEEGTGSYHGKIGEDIQTVTAKKLQRVSGRGSGLVIPGEIVLYRPELSRSGYNAKLTQLECIKPDSEWFEKIEKIFKVDNSSSFIRNKWVYLGQPQYPNYQGDYYPNDQMILKKIIDCNKETIIRPHPAEQVDKYDTYNYDSSRSQWEVIAGKYIDSNNVLIGISSTALFTPKLIYDTEPTIIITIGLFKDYCPPNVLNDLMSLIYDYTALYRDKKKVLIPANMDELTTVLKELKYGENEPNDSF